MISKKGKYLITTDGWFFAPDGEQYCGVWGDAEMITTKDAFDFNPTRSTNWCLKVGGDKEGAVIIAGCQIHYVVKCEKMPVIKEGTYVDENSKRVAPNNKIYFI